MSCHSEASKFLGMGRRLRACLALKVFFLRIYSEPMLVTLNARGNPNLSQSLDWAAAPEMLRLNACSVQVTLLVLCVTDPVRKQRLFVAKEFLEKPPASPAKHR